VNCYIIYATYAITPKQKNQDRPMKPITTHYKNQEALLSFVKQHHIQNSVCVLIQISSSIHHNTSTQTLLTLLTQTLPDAVIAHTLSDEEQISVTFSTLENTLLNLPAKIQQSVISTLLQRVKEQSKTIAHQKELNTYLQERMELALVGSKTSVLDWNFDKQTMYISSSWKAMLGYEKEGLSNRSDTWLDCVHPEDKKELLHQLEKSWDRQTKEIESIHRLKHKQKHWIWVLSRWQVMYDSDAKPIRMIGTEIDITKERELQLKYSHYAQMIAQTYESVYTTDLQGTITSWNKGSELLFGYSTHEMIGESIAKLHTKQTYDTFVKHITKVIEEGESHNILPLIDKSGKTLYISFSFSLLKDEQGIPVEIVAYGQDVSERENNTELTHNSPHYQSNYDRLTGLPNRAFFIDKLQESINHSKSENTLLGLIFINLDRFKALNQSLGHDMGDRVLKSVGQRLKTIIRPTDTLTRLGGDEFTLLIEQLQQAKDIKVLAKKILSCLEEPFYFDDEVVYMTGSMGISLYPEDATQMRDLLKCADIAMHKVKDRGGDGFEFYTSQMTQQSLAQLSMKISIQQALDNNEFIVYYQPQIDMTSNQIIGLEALVRWQHKEKGLLAPHIFIPLAEETGMIEKIDAYVMQHAMRQIVAWREEGLNPGILAVNISTAQLEKESFVKDIETSASSEQFELEWMELEVTEEQMGKKSIDIDKKLNALSALGVKISIDDFGTGSTSLELLKRLPISKVKMDRSFIRGIPENKEDVAIVKSVISLAKTMKLGLVAEGVETTIQKEFLLENRCQYMQGYLYSQPLSSDAMHQILLR